MKLDLGVACFAALTSGITHAPLNSHRTHYEKLAQAQFALARSTILDQDLGEFVQQMDYKLR